MADPFNPTDMGGGDVMSSPDFYRNLMAFGLATMRAANERTAGGFLANGPGAFGAIGAGGLAAMQQGAQNANLRSNIALRNQQAGLYGAEAASKRLSNALQLNSINLYNDAYGLPRLGPDGSPLSSAPPMPEQSAPSRNAPLGGGGAGMPISPASGSSGGGSGAPSSPQVAQGTSPQITQPSAPQMPPTGRPPQGGGAALNVGTLLQKVIRGQMPSSRGEAAQMASLAGSPLVNRPDLAKAYQEYALNTSGYDIQPSGGMAYTPGGPQDPSVIYRNENAKEQAGVGPANQKEAFHGQVQNWVNQNEPRMFRGPGSGFYSPYTGQFAQIPNEVQSTDPNTGRETMNFVPLGVDISRPGAPGASGPANPAPPVAAAPGVTSNQGSATTRIPPVAPQAGPGPAQPATAPSASQTGETGFLKKLGPGEETMMKDLAAQYGEQGKKAYDSAAMTRGWVEQMDHSIDTLNSGDAWSRTGAFAQERLGAAKVFNSLEDFSGIKPSFDPGKIASWEEFNKVTKTAGMQLVNQNFGGSREAASIIQSATSAVPNAENTPLGAKLVLHGIDESSRYVMDKRIFETQWAGSHGGNLMGADEAFNQQRTPQMYSRRAISQVNPYSIKDPSEATRYLPGTLVKTPDGRILKVPGSEDLQMPGQQ